MIGLQGIILLLFWYAVDSSSKYTFPCVSATALRKLRSNREQRKESDVLSTIKVSNDIDRDPKDAENALIAAVNKLCLEIVYDEVRKPVNYIKKFKFEYRIPMLYWYDKLIGIEKHAVIKAFLNFATKFCDYVEFSLIDWHFIERFYEFRNETLAIAQTDSSVRESVEGFEKAAINAFDRAIKFLILNRININLKKFLFFGKNALMFAAENGFKDCVQVLLNNGANPDIKTWLFGKTALMLAVEKNKTDIVDTLLKNNTNPSVKTWLFGKSAIGFAKKNNYEPIVKIIEEHIVNKGNALKATGEFGELFES
jgi:hypothetical protein